MATVTSSATSPQQSDPINPEVRQRMIGEAAYYRSSQRGFAPGHEMEDWLAAEADFERSHRRQQPAEFAYAEEFGMQHGGPHSPAEDDAFKRFIKQHPRRDIPRVESVEPEEAPLKE